MGLSSVFSRTIEITKTGAGGNGGYDVFEKHDDGIWLIKSAKSTLTCVAPGSQECKFTIDPRTLSDLVGPNGSNPNWTDLDDYAKDKIQSNIFTGTYSNNLSINGDLWYRNVSWIATDKYNYKVTINIELAPLP